jgi:2-methylisocitrate lyase-like PEP mutase family enzyme
MYGYPDGEQIPRDLMLEAVGRIVDAVDLPVTADLEAGYGDVDTTIRRAIQVGAVGANLEDEMRPLGDAVSAVRAAIGAGEAEGVPFVLNARTDAYLMAGDRDPAEVLADAIERGQAFLDEGASCVFVPGVGDPNTIAQLVDGIGVGKVSVIARRGGLTMTDLARLGVARVSCGPWTQQLAMEAVAEVGATLFAGGAFPAAAQ